MRRVSYTPLAGRARCLHWLGTNSDRARADATRTGLGFAFGLVFAFVSGFESGFRFEIPDLRDIRAHSAPSAGRSRRPVPQHFPALARDRGVAFTSGARR